MPEVVRVRPRRFGDARGYFSEVFNARVFRQQVADVGFVQDNEALSGAVGTLRGLHFQRSPMAQGKLIRVIRGAIFDVAVDIRKGSPSYGRHVSARLDGIDGDQLWVPVGFAHGYCTLEPDTLVAYKVTNYYSPADDGGILWSDPAIGIEWPVPAQGPVLSAKDLALPLLEDLPAHFSYNSEREDIA
ncbi:dTDP-4-dehydrorhamnose 3,5-epimerase [Labrys sp. LIt4]|uniref:dTDP-4-dehydrorhamnose 3,5-epimerase n=1 Tax=Labrys sp. LIt4 TaxID=2821355 RepID=UPI001AE029D9|nr:dTDP-4-dehydrorhamnose 3,5-epimerase [Labrys sp. LIt4]